MNTQSIPKWPDLPQSLQNGLIVIKTLLPLFKTLKQNRNRNNKIIINKSNHFS